MLWYVVPSGKNEKLDQIIQTQNSEFQEILSKHSIINEYRYYEAMFRIGIYMDPEPIWGDLSATYNKELQEQRKFIKSLNLASGLSSLQVVQKLEKFITYAKQTDYDRISLGFFLHDLVQAGVRNRNKKADSDFTYESGWYRKKMGRKTTVGFDYRRHVYFDLYIMYSYLVFEDLLALKRNEDEKVFQRSPYIFSFILQRLCFQHSEVFPIADGGKSAREIFSRTKLKKDFQYLDKLKHVGSARKCLKALGFLKREISEHIINSY